MVYYKITSTRGNNGMFYKAGLNIDYRPFDPTPSCGPGGIFFSDHEDILAFAEASFDGDYGSDKPRDGFDFDLWSVEIPQDSKLVAIPPSFENEPKKWKANQVILTHVGKLRDHIISLIDNGAKASGCFFNIIFFASSAGLVDVIDTLITRKLDDKTDRYHQYEGCIESACHNGRINVINYFVEHQSSNLSRLNMSCLSGAVRNGHLNVLQLWIEKGHFHPRNHYYASMVLEIAKWHDRTDIVNYLEPWFK